MNTQLTVDQFIWKDEDYVGSNYWRQIVKTFLVFKIAHNITCDLTLTTWSMCLAEACEFECKTCSASCLQIYYQQLDMQFQEWLKTFPRSTAIWFIFIFVWCCKPVWAHSKVPLGLVPPGVWIGGLPVQTGALAEVDLDSETLDSRRGIWFSRL
jgi:hypothetical protein